MKIQSAEHAGISPEAALHLKQNRAATIPLRLTPWLARIARKKSSGRDAPVVAELQRQLAVTCNRHDFGDVAVLEFTPTLSRSNEAGDYAIFIHPGAYILGEAADPTAVLMADALGCPVLSVEYSLAPEHPYPRAIDECVAAYEAITTARGGRFSLIGMSSGGGLALALMQRLLRAGNRLPDAFCLLSPWSEARRLGDSSFANEGCDPLARWKGQLDKAAKAYAGKKSLDDPEISPLRAKDFLGFPPTMIVTGTRDLFLSQCVQLYWRLRKDHVSVDLRVWEGMWHGFFRLPQIPEADHCRDELANFVKSCLSIRTKSAVSSEIQRNSVAQTA